MLTVNEIFLSIQGESTSAGLPCVMVRLTGCNLRCSWCDTTHAFEQGRSMSVAEVVRQVSAYRCELVEITGGEPLLQADAIPLMRELIDVGHTLLLETSGSLPIGEVPEGVRRIIDVKCPGSGESERNHWENLDHLREGDEIKFVLADRADYEWAAERIERHRLAGRCPLLFSPVHGRLAPGELADWVIADRLPVRVQVQLHKVLWPAAARGV